MAELGWIVTSLFLMLQVFSFRAATWESSSSTVRDGDDVTLPCENVTHDQDECAGAAWLFTDSAATVPLFEHGKIHEAANAKSHRLSVAENCSLVIKNVTDGDGGRYDCGRLRAEQTQQEGENAWTLLSVVTTAVTEQKNDDEVLVSCSVSTWEGCRHTVKWLYEGDQNDVVTSQRTCSAWLKMKKSHLDQKPKSSELLKCQVIDRYSGEVHQFTFSPPQSSDDAATKTTMKSPAAIISISTTRNKSGVTNAETSENITGEKKPEGWWRWIVLPVGLAALMMSVVSVNVWTRAKENKTRMEENIEHSDEDDYAMIYENVGDPSVSVSLDG